MTDRQRDLLAAVRDGFHPLDGARGREVGAVVRNLERLCRAGLLFRRGPSDRLRLTLAGRAAVGPPRAC